MIDFLNGASFLAALAIAVVFARYRRRSGDRLFTFFAGAFVLLAADRVILSASGDDGLLALIRLLAFVVALAGIVDKNRGG